MKRRRKLFRLVILGILLSSLFWYTIIRFQYRFETRYYSDGRPISKDEAWERYPAPWTWVSLRGNATNVELLASPPFFRFTFSGILYAEKVLEGQTITVQEYEITGVEEVTTRGGKQISPLLEPASRFSQLPTHPWIHICGIYVGPNVGTQQIVAAGGKVVAYAISHPTISLESIPFYLKAYLHPYEVKGDNLSGIMCCHSAWKSLWLESRLAPDGLLQLHFPAPFPAIYLGKNAIIRVRVEGGPYGGYSLWVEEIYIKQWTGRYAKVIKYLISESSRTNGVLSS